MRMSEVCDVVRHSYDDPHVYYYEKNQQSSDGNSWE